MNKEILKIIKDVAVETKIKVNINETNLDTPFKNLGADSIEVLKLIANVERKLSTLWNKKVAIDNNILMNIKTLNQLIKAFEDLKNK